MAENHSDEHYLDAWFFLLEERLRCAIDWEEMNASSTLDQPSAPTQEDGDRDSKYDAFEDLIERRMKRAIAIDAVKARLIMSDESNRVQAIVNPDPDASDDTIPKRLWERLVFGWKAERRAVCVHKAASMQ